jgi:hypothetical protein
MMLHLKGQKQCNRIKHTARQQKEHQRRECGVQNEAQPFQACARRSMIVSAMVLTRTNMIQLTPLHAAMETTESQARSLKIVADVDIERHIAVVCVHVEQHISTLNFIKAYMAATTKPRDTRQQSCGGGRVGTQPLPEEEAKLRKAGCTCA